MALVLLYKSFFSILVLVVSEEEKKRECHILAEWVHSRGFGAQVSEHVSVFPRITPRITQQLHCLNKVLAAG